MKMNEKPMSYGMDIKFPSGGMEKDAELEKNGALGAVSVGPESADGSQKQPADSMSIFGKGPLKYCQEVHKAPSSNPYDGGGKSEGGA